MGSTWGEERGVVGNSELSGMWRWWSPSGTYPQTPSVCIDSLPDCIPYMVSRTVEKKFLSIFWLTWKTLWKEFGTWSLRGKDDNQTIALACSLSLTLTQNRPRKTNSQGILLSYITSGRREDILKKVIPQLLNTKRRGDFMSLNTKNHLTPWNKIKWGPVVWSWKPWISKVSFKKWSGSPFLPLVFTYVPSTAEKTSLFQFTSPSA